MIGLHDLQWFPKPFGPGDMDGIGEKKVLGRPEMDVINLLVRETAQNAWDARSHGVVPRFELRLRQLDDVARDVLTWNVFGQRVEGSALDKALRSPLLQALEVVDRRTKGLGGPPYNSGSRVAGAVMDYADFILTVGAPPDDLWGGGSYGFGKTASYIASACSTIVVWSRSREADGSFTERFVASSMADPFDLGGQRYTGRQWWGLPPGGNPAAGVLRFDPVEGNDARRLGEAVFERSFAPDETGTSILVLQFRPEVPGRDTDESSAAPDQVGLLLSEAVTRNLWPKLEAAPSSKWAMDISVFVDGREVALPGLTDSPVLVALRSCLEAVRDEQAGRSSESQGNVMVTETSRYGNATGHLALTRLVTDPDLDPCIELVDGVTLMRHKAELVVRRESFGGAAGETVRWVGVFKPLAEFDPVFALAEPPAHDSWANTEGLERSARSIVTVTLRCVRDAVRAYLTPEELPISAENQPTATLSHSLAGLVGQLAGSGASGRASRTKRASVTRPRRPKVDVTRIDPLPRRREDVHMGRQRTSVSISVHSERKSLLRAQSLALAVDGGTMPSEGDIFVDEWEGGEPSGDGVIVHPGDAIRAVVNFPAGMAISFSFSADDL